MPFAFVGRSAELTLIRRRLEQARRPPRSAVVVVSGEPGIGKTRLLQQFIATAAPAKILQGRGSPLGAASPYGLIAEAVESHLRTVPVERLVELAAGRDEELAWLLPSVAAALGRRPAESPPRLAIFEAVGTLLARVAGRAPAALILDDIHDGDPSTWEIVAYLGRNPLPAPLMLVLATRSAPAERGELGSLIRSLTKDGLADEIRLTPLTTDEIATLAEAALGDVSADIVSWLVDRSRGNPLFASSMLALLAEGADRESVPWTVRDEVRAATSSLSPRARKLLENAAVLGDAFLLASLAGLVGEQDLGTLDDLVAAGLLAARAPGSFEFAHPLVREAVYGAIGPERRRGMHRRVGDDPAQPLSVRAAHLLRGALPGDEAALAVVREAASAAEGAQAHREAVAYLHAALELVAPRDDQTRATILDELAWQAQAVGDHLHGLPALRELVRLTSGDPSREASARMRLASFLCWHVAEAGAAEAEAAAALDLFGAAGDEAGRRAALNEWGWIRGSTIGLHAQAQTAREALALARGARDTTIVQHALGSLGHALATTGEFDEALDLVREGLDMAAGSGDRAQVEWFSAVIVEHLFTVGRLPEATAAIAELFDDRKDLTDIGPSRRAVVRFFTGDWGAALEDCRIVQALNAGPVTALSAYSLPLAAVIEAERNQPARARSLLAQGDRVYGGRDLYWFSARNDWLAGRALVVLGDPVGARGRLERSARRHRDVGAVTFLAFCLGDLVDVLVSLSELPGARAVAEELGGIAARFDLPLLDALAALARGLVEPAGAAVQFALSASLAGSCGARVLEARALELQGQAAGADVETLRRAAQIYAALPAPVSEHRVLAALRALGARGKRAAVATGSLSVREAEVARLIAGGISSREAAERLHISQRTVETHLAHVYGKLGISSRVQLAHALLTD